MDDLASLNVRIGEFFSERSVKMLPTGDFLMGMQHSSKEELMDSLYETWFTDPVHGEKLAYSKIAIGILETIDRKLPDSALRFSLTSRKRAGMRTETPGGASTGPTGTRPPTPAVTTWTSITTPTATGPTGTSPTRPTGPTQVTTTSSGTSTGEAAAATPAGTATRHPIHNPSRLRTYRPTGTKRRPLRFFRLIFLLRFFLVYISSSFIV